MISESALERATLNWIDELGYSVLRGQEIAPGEPGAEREDFGEVILTERLRDALWRLNPDVPDEAREEAFRKVTLLDSPSLVENNRAFHRLLLDGVAVECRRPDGSIGYQQVRLVDWDEPDNNDWLAVNQFSVKEGQCVRRPDIVVFVNGLLIAVIELKNPTDETATLDRAFNQVQTYKREIPRLFAYNEVLVISDGLEARIGSLTANFEWFLPWRTIEGHKEANRLQPRLDVLLKGAFDKRRLLSLIRHFVVFEEGRGGVLTKKVAGYHQMHAAQVAVERTIEATRSAGDRQCGVVWHTQGSGKSLTMVFYTGMIVQHPAMENPTIVVITDRNDLDDQLFGTFCRCQELLRQTPIKAESRLHLRELLSTRDCGGVFFTTIQKFFPEERGDTYPELSERRNIVVIADEAHRSQYDFIDGYAKNMRDALPNASFIGFTATPIELRDKNTRAVFGDYISVYDMLQAVADKATVPIYYETRLAKLDLNEAEKPHLDDEFEEVTEAEEFERKEKLKTKWAALEAVVGTDKRIRRVADDLLRHCDERMETLAGKVMIVGMSRRICVELYNAIVQLRPAWHGEDDDKGQIKVVMTGSAGDPLEWQEHIRSKERRERLADKFRDENHPFKVAIVRDMWLTGFDVPCLHTMYFDKPMRGHGLMQAIARVNRVFRDKPGGLIVDYLGLGTHLREAVADYTDSGGRGDVALDQERAVEAMLAKYEVCRDMFHGFDWSDWASRQASKRLALLPPAQEHILRRRDGKPEFLKAVDGLTRAFALSVPHESAIAIRDDVGFFQSVAAALKKPGPRELGRAWKVEHAIQQLVSRAIVEDGVVDIFKAAGLNKPEISILSDEFLAEMRGMPHKNLAVEMLEKLIKDEIGRRRRTNLVEARSFAEMLENTIRKYQNRAIETAQIIEELIDMARKMRESDKRPGELGLTAEEVAFYDALETNDSAVKVLGDETLRNIARELVAKVRENTTIDWSLKESTRAKMRVMVKRILRKHGYPPDKEKKATATVIEQAELLCNEAP
ncbi:MAG: type I restriction endonuclease subunit R [Candidatus Coatesbacteria bacterium]|nr:type I restriction endonuclease subunit R [Candidatus Coatesbacteria bacterium]